MLGGNNEKRSIQDLILKSVSPYVSKFGDFLNDKFDFIDEKVFIFDVNPVIKPAISICV